MPGKPFQSKLEPHFDFILESRRKRQTWESITQLWAAQGVATTKQAVHAFIKRRLKRRYALGMAPAPAAGFSEKSNPAKSLPELPQLTEPQSDFGADPLTLPRKGKTKSPWTVIKPNP